MASSTDAQDEEERERESDDKIIERALRKLGNQRQYLTNDEIERVREMLADWDYRQRRSQAWRANWPLITLLVSFVTSALGWFVSWLASRWGVK